MQNLLWTKDKNQLRKKKMVLKSFKRFGKIKIKYFKTKKEKKQKIKEKDVKNQPSFTKNKQYIYF